MPQPRFIAWLRQTDKSAYSISFYFILFLSISFYFDEHGLALVAVADELHEAVEGAAVYKTLLRA